MNFNGGIVQTALYFILAIIVIVVLYKLGMALIAELLIAPGVVDWDCGRCRW